MKKIIQIFIGVFFLIQGSVFAEVIKDIYSITYKGNTYSCHSNENVPKCISERTSISGIEIMKHFSKNPMEYKLTKNIGKYNGEKLKCTTKRSPETCLARNYGITLKGDSVIKYHACNEWLDETFQQDKHFKISSDGKIIQGDNPAQRFISNKQNTMIGLTSRTKKNDIYNLDIVIIPQHGGFNITRTAFFAPTPSYLTTPGGRMLNDVQNPLVQQHDYFPSQSNRGPQFQPRKSSKIEIVDLAIGENGKCYVKSYFKSDNFKAKQINAHTQTCHALRKFKDKNPEIRKCGDPAVFSELKKILQTSKGQKNKQEKNKNIEDINAIADFVKDNSLSEEFNQGLNEAFKLIGQAQAKIKDCSEANLTDFVKDDSLFEKTPAYKKAKHATRADPN